MTKQRIHRIYGILLSIVIVAAGVCLIAACVAIYRSGDHPFSREAVAEHFAPIAVPVYLCIAMIIGGFILNLFLPGEREKSALKNSALILKRLQEKTDLSACDETLCRAITAQRKNRRLHQGISIVLLAVCTVIFLAYALNRNHFQMPDINGSMIRAMKVLIPCLVIPFAYAVFSAYYSRASIEKEIALLKQAGTAERKPRDAAEAKKPRSWRVQLPELRCAILIVGIGLLLIGLFSGGTTDVLTKAINICTECVGLG